MHKLLALAASGVLIGIFFTAQLANAQVNVEVGASASVEDTSPPPDGRNPEEVDVSTNTEAAAETSSTDASGQTSLSLTRDDAAAASIDAESAELSAGAVTDSEDLSLYATGKMKRDTNIESVDASGDEVVVTYRQPARLLGFIPGSITATATVTNDGDVTLDYPWYRFLYAVKGSADVRAALEARVGELMANADGTLSASLEAALIDAIHTAFSATAATNTTADAGVTADTAGPDVNAAGTVETGTEVELDPNNDAGVEVY